MARRLPIYLLLDTSGSMFGEPIQAVNEGVQTLVSTLKSDPYALETVWLSVITFDATARQVSPLTEIAAFQAPALEASGTTSLGAALALTAQKMEEEVVRNTSTQKGDWRPLVFIMTDGMPTDDINVGLPAFAGQKANVIACAAGQGASTQELQKITETVVRLDTLDAATAKSFFKWITASIQQTSKGVEEKKGDIDLSKELPPPPSEVILVD